MWKYGSNFSECQLCGDFVYQYQDVKCIKGNGNITNQVVDDVECNILTKPIQSFIECDSSNYACDAEVCSNSYWEDSEECEISLDSQCCTNNCTRVDSIKKLILYVSRFGTKI